MSLVPGVTSCQGSALHPLHATPHPPQTARSSWKQPGPGCPPLTGWLLAASRGPLPRPVPLPDTSSEGNPASLAPRVPPEGAALTGGRCGHWLWGGTPPTVATQPRRYPGRSHSVCNGPAPAPPQSTGRWQGRSPQPPARRQTCPAQTVGRAGP